MKAETFNKCGCRSNEQKAFGNSKIPKNEYISVEINRCWEIDQFQVDESIWPKKSVLPQRFVNGFVELHRQKNWLSLAISSNEKRNSRWQIHKFVMLKDANGQFTLSRDCCSLNYSWLIFAFSLQSTLRLFPPTPHFPVKVMHSH